MYNEITNKEFGDRLSRLRKQAGYEKHRELALVMCGFSKTQKGFSEDEAQLISRKRRNIGNWENGVCKPSFSDFAVLCQLLDCDPEHLLYTECVDRRKETRSVMKITGLSEEAVNTIKGLNEYCSRYDLWTLDFILRNEDFWRFFKRDTEKPEGANLLLALRQYLSNSDEENVYLVKLGDESGFPFSEERVSMGNYIMPGGHLAQRVNLDGVIDAVKELKKRAEREKPLY